MKARFTDEQIIAVDLRQGAISAKAIRAEQRATRAVSSALPGSPAKEAQDLIDGILGSEDGGDLADIYEEMDDELSHRTLEERLGASGCGIATKVSAADILAKLKSQSVSR
jgi:hypothetical protein